MQTRNRAGLNEKELLALALRFLGWGVGDIARKLGVKRRTVSVYASRAKRVLTAADWRSIV